MDVIIAGDGATTSFVHVSVGATISIVIPATVVAIGEAADVAAIRVSQPLRFIDSFLGFVVAAH